MTNKGSAQILKDIVAHGPAIMKADFILFYLFISFAIKNNEINI